MVEKKNVLIVNPFKSGNMGRTPEKRTMGIGNRSKDFNV